MRCGRGQARYRADGIRVRPFVAGAPAGYRRACAASASAGRGEPRARENDRRADVACRPIAPARRSSGIRSTQACVDHLPRHGRIGRHRRTTRKNGKAMRYVFCDRPIVTHHVRRPRSRPSHDPRSRHGAPLPRPPRRLPEPIARDRRAAAGSPIEPSEPSRPIAAVHAARPRARTHFIFQEPS